MPLFHPYGDDRNVAYGAILLTLIGSFLLLPQQFLSDNYLIAIGMTMRGAGIGVLTILSMSGAYQGLTPTQVAHASPLTRIVTYLAATIGAAIMSLLITSPVVMRYPENSNYFYAHLALITMTILCGLICRRLPGRAI